MKLAEMIFSAIAFCVIALLTVLCFFAGGKSLADDLDEANS